MDDGGQQINPASPSNGETAFLEPEKHGRKYSPRAAGRSLAEVADEMRDALPVTPEAPVRQARPAAPTVGVSEHDAHRDRVIRGVAMQAFFRKLADERPADWHIGPEDVRRLDIMIEALRGITPTSADAPMPRAE